MLIAGIQKYFFLFQDENLIATAATNGAVVLWNLGKSSKSKQSHVFTEHTRTVNKVMTEEPNKSYYAKSPMGL